MLVGCDTLAGTGEVWEKHLPRKSTSAGKGNTSPRQEEGAFPTMGSRKEEQDLVRSISKDIIMQGTQIYIYIYI